ncbi:MAG: PAS domain S-box protein [Noviherbaspirillum sp.]
MTTHLEHGAGKPFNCTTTLSRFPASKFGPSLLSVIQSTTDGVVIVDARRQIVLVNHKAERMFGYSATHLLDKSLDILLPPRLGSEQRRRVERLAATRVNGRRTRIELQGIRANGEQIAVNTGVSRVTVHGESFLALILHEATAHNYLHESRQRPIKISDLRKWAASTQQASEVEKRRFSKKLYDDIGQRLSVLKLDLDWLETALPGTDECFPARLALMQGLLDNVITMTKSMASTLRPPLLDDFGLLPAVEWMAENFQKRTSIACSVESKGLTNKLDAQIESAVFRVVQEGLSNIERHAHARNAKIVLLHTASQLDVMIQDDGVGMENGSENKPGCYGLIAMQERIFVLGGTISMRNIRPQGLVIHASIPIDPVFHTDSTASYPPKTRP